MVSTVGQAPQASVKKDTQSISALSWEKLTEQSNMLA